VQNYDPVRVEQSSDPFCSRSYLYLAFLLATVTAFHVATVREGHLWGDDFAMYIHHAQNIAEGRAYADTGYIYNAAIPVYGPRMYPPVFPLLLAPFYKIFGLSLLPMKLEQVLFIILTLALVFVLWHRHLGTGHCLALVAILGFSPALWWAKENILSDLPFLFFFYAAMCLLQWAPSGQKQCWTRGLVLGVTLYLVIGTRTAGIAIVPGLLLYEWLRHKRISRYTGVALVICAMALIAQNWFVGAVPGNYMEQLHSVTARTILLNAIRYTRTLAGFWVGGVPGTLSFLVIAIVAALMCAGLLSERGRGVAAVHCLLAPYTALMILWPFGAGIRYALPALPWMAFLALSGLRELSARFCPRYPAAAAWAFLLLLAVPMIQAYRATDFGPIRQSTGLPEFNALCDEVRRTTKPEDIFIYYRARALSLYAGRPASSYNQHGTQAEFREYVRSIHAKYLITTNAFNEDEGFLAQYVEAHPDNLDLTYENPRFSLYRIHAPAEAAAASLSR
jgi:Dolichyl-phosphate-mannose-protein mannosyltransferase